jgi:type I restriction enzyme M protein
LANIVRLWRGQEEEVDQGSAPLMTQHFGDDGYKDIPGLCRVASRAEIAAQDWSLNPGRYVGVAAGNSPTMKTSA